MYVATSTGSLPVNYITGTLNSIWSCYYRPLTQLYTFDFQEVSCRYQVRYRYIMHWIDGHLGQDIPVRVPLPTCVVTGYAHLVIVSK